MPNFAAPLRSADQLSTFVESLAFHEVRLLGGLDLAGLRDHLGTAAPMTRPMVALDLAGSAASIVCRKAIVQISREIDALWPFAWDGEDFSKTRGDPLTLAHLPIRLETLAGRLTGLSQSWAKAVVETRIRGAAPRAFASNEIEWEQLCLMLSPGGLVVVTELDPAQPAAPFVSAVEWLSAQAKAAVVILSPTLPSPLPEWTRLFHGASRFEIAAPSADDTHDVSRGPGLVSLPSVEGRPHPLSAIELRLFQHLQADAELQPLFAYNIVLSDLALLQAKVDAVWRAGRVVVEVDGVEHRAAGRYRADRDRDHRLMCAGYRVLRLTNEEVAEDCGRAVEKIREVVRLARRHP